MQIHHHSIRQFTRASLLFGGLGLLVAILGCSSSEDGATRQAPPDTGGGTGGTGATGGTSGVVPSGGSGGAATGGTGGIGGSGATGGTSGAAPSGGAAGEGSGGTPAAGPGGTGGSCTNVRPTGTDWDDATCDDWATQTAQCAEAWMNDNGYCDESCGRCTVDTGGAGGTGGTGGVLVASAENEGADCQLSGPLPGAINNSLLPDPFTKLDGTRLSTRDEWRCRRQEIVRLAENHIYGVKPPKPESVTGTVSSSSITVNLSHQGRTTSFTAGVQMPSGAAGPVPAIVGLGGGFFLGLDANLVRGEGVAIIDYDPYAVGSEAASRSNKAGAFYDIYGSDSDAGLLVAWAWGVSRIIDVIEASGGDVLRANAIGVTGCSRFGKGAFAIGAFDQRIALTIPFESGSGGVPIWRGIPGEGAQSPSSAYGETYWLGDAFGQFTNHVNGLPLDTHEVVAMVAPRGLLILDNPHIANLGPRSAHVAALGGAEVYRALGAGDNISYHSDVNDGSHCAWRPEFADPLRQNIQKFLTGTGNQPGAITARSSATGNLEQWRDWNTPALQ